MNVFKNFETAKNYDTYYRSDFGRRVDEIEKKLLSSLLNNVPRAQLLELGCGTGHWTRYFLEQGFQVTATDNSEAMLNLAREKELNARIIHADAANLPFERHEFEAVASVTMLEFVQDQAVVFDEMYRVLKPSGWLILGCLNANSMLAENRNSDPVFKEAKFFTPEELKDRLSLFGESRFAFGVYINSAFQLLDDTGKKGSAEPAFIAAVVRKKK